MSFATITFVDGDFLGFFGFNVEFVEIHPNRGGTPRCAYETIRLDVPLEFRINV